MSILASEKGIRILCLTLGFFAFIDRHKKRQPDLCRELRETLDRFGAACKEKDEPEAARLAGRMEEIMREIEETAGAKRRGRELSDGCD